MRHIFTLCNVMSTLDTIHTTGGDDILGPHAGLQCVARLVADCRGETAPARTSQRSTSRQRAGPGHAQHRGTYPRSTLQGTVHSEGIWGLMIAWVTVGHLGVTVGHFRATAGHLRVIKGPLRVRN